MATEASETLSQMNYRMITQLDWMSAHQDVRKAQMNLVTNSLNRYRWVQLANLNNRHAAVGMAILSGGIYVTAIGNDIGLIRPWQQMGIWKSCVPSSPARLRLMDSTAPTTAFAETDVESCLHDEDELTCKPELLRDGVVGPISLVNAGSIYKYLFKDGHENGRFVPAFQITTTIIYAVSYRHEIESDAKMSEANFIRIVRALKAIHPQESVFIWIDQQLRKCPERGEWIKRGLSPYVAFPTVRLAHHGPERVWIALEKTAAARHCVRVDVSTDRNQVTLIVNNELHLFRETAMDAVAGFMCGELVTTFGVTYKSDLAKLRNWAKRRLKSLTTPQLCSFINHGTRAYFTGGRREAGWRTPDINCWSPTPLNSIGPGRRAEINYKGQRFVRAEFNCFVLSGKGLITTGFLVRLNGRHVTQFVTIDARFAVFLDFAVEEHRMPYDSTAKHLVRCDNGAVERVGRLLEVRWMSSCEFDGLR